MIMTRVNNYNRYYASPLALQTSFDLVQRNIHNNNLKFAEMERKASEVGFSNSGDSQLGDIQRNSFELQKVIESVLPDARQKYLVAGGSLDSSDPASDDVFMREIISEALIKASSVGLSTENEQENEQENEIDSSDEKPLRRAFIVGNSGKVVTIGTLIFKIETSQLRFSDLINEAVFSAAKAANLVDEASDWKVKILFIAGEVLKLLVKKSVDDLNDDQIWLLRKVKIHNGTLSHPVNREVLMREAFAEKGMNEESFIRNIDYLIRVELLDVDETNGDALYIADSIIDLKLF